MVKIQVKYYMAIIVKCKKCKKEVEGKASLLVIPLDEESVKRIMETLKTRFKLSHPVRDEDLVRKIHICNPCMEKIEKFIEV